MTLLHEKPKFLNFADGKLNNADKILTHASHVFLRNFRKCIMYTFQTIITSGKRRRAQLCCLPERPRRGRTSITAGWAAAGSEACGPMTDGKIVLEEGEHKQAVQLLPMFALFEDVFIILLWNRRLRSLRSLHQRLWMFALFEDALASDKVKRGDVLASDKVKRGDVLV